MRSLILCGKCSSLILLEVLLVSAGCRPIPKATAEEIATRDRWASLISPQDRQRVIEEAERHGDWGEKRKIRFEVERFSHLYNKQHNVHATQATSTTGATTQPSTAPSGQ